MWVTRLATFCPHVVPRKATKTTLFEILVFWEFGHRNTLFGGDRKVHQVKGGHSRFWGALTWLMSEITAVRSAGSASRIPHPHQIPHPHRFPHQPKNFFGTFGFCEKKGT